MDYAYFSAAQQPAYHFMTMPPNPYQPITMDPASVRSIVSCSSAPHSASHRASAHLIGQEQPLDHSMYQPNYEAFTIHGLPTPQLPSPDAGVAHTPLPMGSIDSGLGGDVDDRSRTRSSSEEKESVTPAQSRRKAQNRAAQRAFRERRERHVRDLETKLSVLENSTHSMQSENERLKLALQQARTENEILRATSGHSPTTSRPVSVSYPSPGAHVSTEDNEKDSVYNVQTLINGCLMMATDYDPAAPPHKVDPKEVTAAQAWDLMQSHPLIQQGSVDVADACERLKGAALCGGIGPVFEESSVRRAVEESRRSGGDELI